MKGTKYVDHFRTKLFSCVCLIKTWQGNYIRTLLNLCWINSEVKYKYLVTFFHGQLDQETCYENSFHITDQILHRINLLWKLQPSSYNLWQFFINIILTLDIESMLECWFISSDIKCCIQTNSKYLATVWQEGMAKNYISFITPWPTTPPMQCHFQAWILFHRWASKVWSQKCERKGTNYISRQKTVLSVVEKNQCIRIVWVVNGVHAMQKNLSHLLRAT